VSVYQHKSDAQLVDFIANGNHAAFAEMVTRHTDKFFALAFRTLQHQGDAEDVVQSAFINFWQRPQMWRADKAKFTTWFYRVIINACHDHRRRRSREVLVEPEVFEKTMHYSPSEESRASNKQDQHWRQCCLESAMASLPSSQRDALNLVVYSELPQKQAAEILGVSLKALESLLIRAKRNLSKHIDALPKQIIQSQELEMQSLSEEPNVY
jgi:RNA polymerase sigma-70 factor (ECF subfamily)